MIADINAGLGLIALIVSVANTLGLLIERWRRPSAAKIERLECDVESLDRRVQTIEGEIKHLPTATQVHELGIQITGLTGSMRVLEAELGGAARAVRRMEEHLLAGKV